MRIERVIVGDRTVDVTLRALAPDGTPARTTPEIAGRVFAILPGLAGHSCRNTADLTLADELSDTELPHLFEHLVLELMAEAGSPRSLAGATAWDFAADGPGVYYVSLEYDDDLVCLGAIKCASAIVEYALGGSAAPDVPSRLVRLRQLRATPGHRSTTQPQDRAPAETP